MLWNKIIIISFKVKSVLTSETLLYTTSLPAPTYLTARAALTAASPIALLVFLLKCGYKTRH